jgi:hypothetical protein
MVLIIILFMIDSLSCFHSAVASLNFILQFTSVFLLHHTAVLQDKTIF